MEGRAGKKSRVIFLSSAICGLLAVGAACIGWEGKIPLSVGVGGVIGLANLALWDRLVRSVVAHRTEGDVGAGALAVRMVLKVIPIGLLLWVVMRTSLDPLAVMIGFGSVLFGMVWGGVVEGSGKGECS
ncbi:MAG: ATP synthase subunit I [Deltaproteobacteria bacterium]|nr:ATP synthase subunit I [Deltaproteobacteria bacterium]